VTRLRSSELDEFRSLIAEGQERGFLTFEQIATCLEEVEVTKEQVQELHAYLDEQGIDVVEADGGLARSEAAASRRARAVSRARRRASTAQEGRDRPDRRAEPRFAAAVPALDRRVTC
jgi:RNA polymerase primary sigma factor